MKRITFLCLFLVSFYAHADMVLTETIETHGRTINTTLKIKGENIRMDFGAEMSTITDTSTGDSVSMMHSRKSYIRVPASKTKDMMEQLRKVQSEPSAGQTPVPKPKPVDTGRTKKLNNFNAKIYTMEAANGNITLWVTKDVPNYAALRDKLKKLRTMIRPGPSPSTILDAGEIDGLPVKTQVVAKGETTTITILSAVEQPINESEMVPPADYTEIVMPGGSGSSPRQP